MPNFAESFMQGVDWRTRLNDHKLQLQNIQEDRAQRQHDRAQNDAEMRLRGNATTAGDFTWNLKADDATKQKMLGSMNADMQVLGLQPWTALPDVLESTWNTDMNQYRLSVRGGTHPEAGWNLLEKKYGMDFITKHESDRYNAALAEQQAVQVPADTQGDPNAPLAQTATPQSNGPSQVSPQGVTQTQATANPQDSGAPQPGMSPGTPTDSRDIAHSLVSKQKAPITIKDLVMAQVTQDYDPPMSPAQLRTKYDENSLAIVKLTSEQQDTEWGRDFILRTYRDGLPIGRSHIYYDKDGKALVGQDGLPTMPAEHFLSKNDRTLMASEWSRLETSIKARYQNPPNPATVDADTLDDRRRLKQIKLLMANPTWTAEMIPLDGIDATSERISGTSLHQQQTAAAAQKRVEEVARKWNITNEQAKHKIRNEDARLTLAQNDSQWKKDHPTAGSNPYGLSDNAKYSELDAKTKNDAFAAGFTPEAARQQPINVREFLNHSEYLKWKDEIDPTTGLVKMDPATNKAMPKVFDGLTSAGKKRRDEINKNEADLISGQKATPTGASPGPGTSKGPTAIWEGKTYRPQGCVNFVNDELKRRGIKTSNGSYKSMPNVLKDGNNEVQENDVLRLSPLPGYGSPHVVIVNSDGTVSELATSKDGKQVHVSTKQTIEHLSGRVIGIFRAKPTAKVKVIEKPTAAAQPTGNKKPAFSAAYSKGIQKLLANGTSPELIKRTYKGRWNPQAIDAEVAKFKAKGKRT